MTLTISLLSWITTLLKEKAATWKSDLLVSSCSLAILPVSSSGSIVQVLTKVLLVFRLQSFSATHFVYDQIRALSLFAGQLCLSLGWLAFIFSNGLVESDSPNHSLITIIFLVAFEGYALTEMIELREKGYHDKTVENETSMKQQQASREEVMGILHSFPLGVFIFTEKQLHRLVGRAGEIQIQYFNQELVNLFCPLGNETEPNIAELAKQPNLRPVLT
mmetsp:Transcript_24361/g.37725  ORF Transcript_24361/g.37725 Transcript_24361/m.37725 type:complete len:219 (-) Transcript_24361:3565-4221(-)